MEAIARDARPSKSTCLLVARKGKVVGEWNWGGVEPETPREVFSVTKSITSTLVGMAQADGDLDIDDRAKRYIEEWRGTKSRAVTIRDILGNVSGRFWDIGTDYGDLPQAEDRTQFAIDLDQLYPPGKVWTYNNAAIQTLDRVISTATGQETRTFAAERLFGPLGMTHTQMTADPAGNTNAFFGTQTTCEDLARFGYLFLRKGRWGDDQVVSRSWVKAAVGQSSQDHNAAYGLLWWLNRKGSIIGPLATDAPGQPTPPVGQTMPGLPANAFTAQGLGGQVVLVDPMSETVVVRIGQFQASPTDAYTGNDAARFITDALVQP
jgi:CubicO group peptidase (beta-lactamase class C family)